MTGLSEIEKWLHERLPGLIAEHRIPALAVAVSVGDDVIDHAAGVLSTATGVEATTDSVFQIGSVTKLWTATLAMQLVDEARLELDAPVRRYLSGFRVADEAASAAVTVRQLLTHTAGFAGDIFRDTGRNDDCVQKYVDGLGDVEQDFAPGEMFSYNNAAFTVLGRIVEVLRGKPFAACLREHLIEPLGLAHAPIGAEEAILFRAAVGHVPAGPGRPEQPAPVWNLVPAHVPAGSLLATSARDLIGFARMQLRDGVGPDGSAVVSPAAVAAMRAPQVELPPLTGVGDSWGLGWELDHWPDGTVIGHSGGTLGQSSVLRMVPAADVAIVLLANGGAVGAAYRELCGLLLGELAGVRLPEPPVPPDEPERIDAERYAGTYSSPSADLTVTADGDSRLLVREVPKGMFASFEPPGEPEPIVRLDGDTFIKVEADQGVHRRMTFLGDDDQGRARYLHGGRASRRSPP
jgi:CubicO group peptidase (beta-lactamase class C family)